MYNIILYDIVRSAIGSRQRPVEGEAGRRRGEAGQVEAYNTTTTTTTTNDNNNDNNNNDNRDDSSCSPGGRPTPGRSTFDAWSSPASKWGQDK